MSRQSALRRSTSLESVSSTNIGNTRTPQATSGNSREVRSPIYSCAAVLIHCEKHQMIGLQPVPGKKGGLFFPFEPVFNDESFEQVAKAMLKRVLASNKGSKGYLSFKPLEVLLYLQQVVMPMYDHIVRAIFLATLAHEGDDGCCSHAGNLTWIPRKDAIMLSNPLLFGIEVPILTNLYCNGDKNEKKGRWVEQSIAEVRRLISKSVDLSRMSERQALVRGAEYSDADIYRMYQEFIIHVFPSQYMTFASFLDYMTRFGFFENDQGRKDATFYFNAFRSEDNNPWLNFEDFCAGLAAAEKATPHGSVCGEARTGYLFRFYDFDRNKKLDLSEVGRLIYDARKTKGEAVDKAALEAASQAVYKGLNVPSKTPLTQDQLVHAIGQMHLRGTSVLFRSGRTFRKMASSPKLVYQAIPDEYKTVKAMMNGGNTQSPATKCQSCRPKSYTLAGHGITINEYGYVVEPVSLNFENNKRAPSRSQSELSFSSCSANLLIDRVRDYAEVTNISPGASRTKKPKNYLAGNVAETIDMIYKLCGSAEKIFKQENRMIKVQSPCYVFGDTHGNLKDLLQYERVMWRRGPHCEPANYLFLGDYVDRGADSLEVIMYLLSLKVISPNKVLLLRGNHEIRTINQSFTFYKELVTKLGPKHGPEMWERFNQVFDFMPICAVVDEAIFCAHGGIPHSNSAVEDLLSIATPLAEPERLSPGAHEMLWNDPITDKDHSENLELIRATSSTAAVKAQADNGWVANTKRGTAFYFAPVALKKFLKENKLSHCIRAHEVCQDGFTILHSGALITVFSSSKYGQSQNSSGCIFVEHGKLRPIKFDTD